MEVINYYKVKMEPFYIGSTILKKSFLLFPQLPSKLMILLYSFDFNRISNCLLSLVIPLKLGTNIYLTSELSSL